MKIIRWKFFGFFIIIMFLLVAAVYLGAGPFMRWSLETSARKATGLPVTIENVSFSAAPGEITITGVQWPDAEDQNQNALQIEEIKAGLRLGPLLRGNIIISQADISGATTDVKRAEPWVPLPDLPESEDKSEEESPEWLTQGKVKVAEFSAGVGANASQLIAERQQSLEITQAKNALSVQLDDGDQVVASALNDVPTAQQIDDWQLQVDQLLKSQPKSIEELKELDQRRIRLTNSINAGLKAIQDAEKATSDHASKLSQLANRLAGAPAKDVRSLSSQLSGENVELDKIAEMLFGEKLTGQIRTGLKWYQRLAPYLSSSDEPEIVLPEGRIWTFPTKEPEPGFWLKQASVDLRHKGVVTTMQLRDFSSSYQQIQAPARVSFTQQRLQGIVSGEVEIIPNLSQFSARWLEIPVKDMNMMQSGDRLIRLRSAKLSGGLEGELKDRRMAVSSQSDFSSASWTVSGMPEALVTGFNGIDSFNLNVGLSGPVLQPGFSVSSDLDRQLSNSWKASIDRQLQQVREDIRKQLQSQAEDAMQPLRAQQQELAKVNQQAEELKEQLLQAREELDAAKARWEKQVSAETDKAKQQLNNQLKKQQDQLNKQLQDNLKLPGF